MRFVTLVTLRDSSGAERFVYGHALPYRPQLREAREWRSIQRAVDGKISLARYTSVLGEDAFAELHTAFLRGTMLRLPIAGEKESIVRSRPLMVQRGVVRASRAESERLTPLVYADEDHRTLWGAEPVAVYDDLLGLVTGAPEQRAVNLRRFLSLLRELVPVPFDSGQFWRVGCFEVIDAVVPGGGDDDVRIELLNNRSPLGLRIELRGAVAKIATHLRVRVDVGAGGVASQRLVDRVILIKAPHLCEVDLLEAGVNFRIDVYGGADGHCVCSRVLARITGAAVSSFIVPEGGLLERLPPELAEHVRTGISQRHPGLSRADPWATAQAAAAAYERRDFPAPSLGFNMVHEPDGQRDLVRAFLASAGAGTITIADPYFDDEALISHFVGRRDLAADLIIVTSLDDDTRSSESEEATSVSKSGDPSLCTTQLATALSLRDLLDAAKKHHNNLPRRLRIVNVASTDAGNGQQFHDRFIRVRSDTNDILWWLGNSLNSAGTRRYPLFAAEISGQQRIEFGEYVRLLGEGNVRGRPEARGTTHFTNRWTYEPVAPVTPQHSEMEAFPGWERVLAILGSVAGVSVDTSNEAAIDASIEALRRSGVLADHTPHPSWAVLDERKADVAAYLADLIKRPGDHSALVADLATWAYKGGFRGGDLSLNCRTVARVLRFTNNIIEQSAAADPLAWSFTSCTFEDAIHRAIMRLERGDFHDAIPPLLTYARDVAIANAPNLYWRFVVRSRRDRVYASVTAYDWNAIRSAEPAALQDDLTLIAQAVAVLLESHEPEHARELIRAASLSPIEQAFGLTTILVSERGPLEETWPLLEPTWADIVISSDIAVRLERLLERHPHDLELLARFADAHPESPQFRDLLISEWVRYLPFRGQPAPEGRGSSSAYRAAQPMMADIVVRQFLASEQPAQRFNAAVLERLNLNELIGPFARESDYQAWHEAGAAGARVLFVGCQIVGEVKDGALLLDPLARLAVTLSVNRWGDASHDLVAVNAAIALARAARTHPPLRIAADELLGTPAVPEALRFAVALWLDDDAESVEARTADISVDAALQPFLPEQRAGVVAAFIRRLNAVAPNGSIIARLVELEAAPNQGVGADG